ncbi:hypothetical protein [Maridesulfovibrio sp.]|uniref:hypothetical protein n=1 Tax=Maridesulfovibrio sp. TaxID=2795000 RepID=UPI0039F08D3A
MKSIRLVVTILLAASVANLSLMIPGGTVETREFTQYSTLVLASFNIFLTCLGFGSLAASYFVYKQNKGYLISVLLGVAYLAVYISDLAQIFPVSQNPMSATLARMEWIGSILGAALTGAAIFALRGTKGESASFQKPKLPFMAKISLTIIAAIIVIYATISAMGYHPL